METTALILFSTGVIVLLFTLYKFWYKQGNLLNNSVHQRYHQSRKDFTAKHNNQFAPGRNGAISDSEKKGNEFEKFVVTLFDRQYFTILDWRSDKSHNGMYALSSMYPDIEWRYSSKSQTVHFATECKWRQGFINDRVQWAKDHQLDNYRRFEQEKGIPVFIILGIGGQPSNPDHVYVIPLPRLQTTYLYRQQLREFKRYRADKQFFLDTGRMALE